MLLVVPVPCCSADGSMGLPIEWWDDDERSHKTVGGLIASKKLAKELGFVSDLGASMTTTPESWHAQGGPVNSRAPKSVLKSDNVMALRLVSINERLEHGHAPILLLNPDIGM